MKNLPKTYRTRFSQGLRLNPAIACLATALWVTLASPAALAAVKGWDSGLANDLFKDGNPPGQLREAKCKDKDCIDAMENLQAALNDWYALELSEGQQDKKDAVSIQDKADNKAKNDEGDAKIKEAIAGLGQPKDKGKLAQKKQEQNSAKDANEKGNKGKSAKDILKDKIKKLLEKLLDCEKTKCPPPEQPITPTPTPTPQPVVPGGGGGGQAKPPPPNITIPPLPAGGCFKDQAEKDAFLDKLDKIRKPIFDQWYIDRKEANEDKASQVAKDKFAQSDANLRAIDAAIAAANTMGLCPTPTPKPSGGGAKTPPPGKGKPKAPPKVRTGGNVSLPEDNFCALISENKIKIDSVGTGETIGHIGDLKIKNLTDQPVTCYHGPAVVESKSRKGQDYVCPRGQTVTIAAHDTATVPMDGVCINRNKPPVGKGVTGDLILNTGDPNVPQNPNSHIPAKQARDLLRICTSKYDAAEKLQKDGALKDLPYKDKQKQKDIVVQWSTWCDPRISEITGAPPATKDDLRKVVYKQVEAKGPMSPETKKKVDQGIDTIFEKVELTTAKAKDLEKPEGSAEESTPAESSPPQ